MNLLANDSPSFYQLLISHAHEEGDRPALIYGDGYLSYQLLVQHVEARRHWLADVGVQPGRSVVVWISNKVQAWLMLLALRAIGVSTICISQVQQIKALELEGYDHLLILEQEKKQNYPAAAQTLIRTLPVLVAPQRYGFHAPPPAIISAPVPRPSIGHTLYTSGTTGVYKKLLRDESADTAVAVHRAAWFGYNRDTVFGDGGLGTWTAIGYKQPLAVWAAGGCVVFTVSGQRWKDFCRYKISHTYLIPTGVTELLAQAHRHDGAHQDFQLVIGAGFLSEIQTRDAQQRLTRFITFTYGSTELNPPPMRLQFQGEDVYWYTPSDPVRTEVVDEHGAYLPFGQEGILRIRLTELDYQAYYGDPQASLEMFRAGFFYPGDMAIARPNGDIRITGRTSDVLVIKGQKFTAVVHEQKLQQHLRGIEVCLLSAIDVHGHEVVVVALQASPSAEHLTAIREVLAGPLFDHLKLVYFSRFPRNDTGTNKIKRSEIRAAIRAKGLIQ